MKPLLNTLFVNQDEAYLALDGGNVVVVREEKELARFPLHNFEQITTFGYTGASPALMRKCAEERKYCIDVHEPGGKISGARYRQDERQCPPAQGAVSSCR